MLIVTLSFLLCASATKLQQQRQHDVAGIITDNKTVIDYLHDFVTIHDIRIATKRQASAIVCQRAYKEWTDDGVKSLAVINVKAPQGQVDQWLSHTLSLLTSSPVNVTEADMSCQSSGQLSRLAVCDGTASARLMRTKRFKQVMHALYLHFMLHHWQHQHQQHQHQQQPHTPIMDPQEALSTYYEALWLDQQTVAAGYFLFVLAVGSVVGVAWWAARWLWVTRRRRQDGKIKGIGEGLAESV